MKQSKSSFSKSIVTKENKSIAFENDQTRIKILLRSQNRDRYYNAQFEKKQLRASILKGFIFGTCEALNLRFGTCAMAVTLFDQMLSKFKICSDQLVMLAGVALGLLLKLNERDLISYQDIFRINGIFGVSSEVICRFEKKILEATEFKINVITPFHFLEEFFMIKKLKGTKINNNFNTDREKRNLKLIKKIYSLLVLNYEVYKYSSLTIAVIVLMIARNLFLCDFELFCVEEFYSISENSTVKNVCSVFQNYLLANLQYL